MPLPHLYSPIEIRGKRFKNRVFSSGHQTVLVNDGTPNDALLAYHEARARGGAGLIVTEIGAVHESAFFSTHTIKAYEDLCIPGYRRLAEMAHRHDCRMFGQLFHPGREVYGMLPDGRRPVAYGPSTVPAERYQMPTRPMSITMIAEVIEGYAKAAARMKAAGLDGAEIVASHGYLPAQFLNSKVNLRTDAYGGSDENRRRFLEEALRAVRNVVGESFIVGIRISVEEKTEDGLSAEDVLGVLKALDREKLVDYVSLVAGTSNSSGGAIHIVPPMRVPQAYLGELSGRVKAALGIPVMLTGRINQPQIAEKVLQSGQADMCGMTRAMISDPDMPNKALAGRYDDIRACIACNQACIHHMQIDVPISCIQRPETGRELKFGVLPNTLSPKRVVVIGGGPAGIKAAATAASRGHKVTLYEQQAKLGGQARLAQLLPGREEFGGLITNLARELELSGVTCLLRQRVDEELLKQQDPDAIVLATGAGPRRLAPERAGSPVLDPWQVLNGSNAVGKNVVIADWKGDWIGFGLAEKLARQGHSVRFVTTAAIAGQSMQSYLRDQWMGILSGLGVPVATYHRFYAMQDGTAYFQHTVTEAALEIAGVDTVIASIGHESTEPLDLGGFRAQLFTVGDALVPRTAEEAIYEGFEAGRTI